MKILKDSITLNEFIEDDDEKLYITSDGDFHCDEISEIAVEHYYQDPADPADLADDNYRIPDDEIQKFFKEKQLVKTLWPMVRQQVLDGMSRLGLPPIPLPWLF